MALGRTLRFAGAATVALLLATLGLSQLVRLADRRSDEQLMNGLRTSPPSSQTFTPKMVEDLPDPARRYFLYAIRPGTALKFVADLEMEGQLSLGSRQSPNYLPMTAQQVLTLDSFVWRVRAGSPRMWLEGSDGYADGAGWTRFWLFNVVPVVRAGGGDDFARSAAGQAVAESLFWAPATLLPSRGVRWEAIDEDTARAIVMVGENEHRLELKVAQDGRPLSVSILRWSQENPDRTWRLQPFGGTIGEIKEVGGYRVAAAIEGGNWFGTPDYFPFYRARVTRIRLI